MHVLSCPYTVKTRKKICHVQRDESKYSDLPKNRPVKQKMKVVVITLVIVVVLCKLIIRNVACCTAWFAPSGQMMCFCDDVSSLCRWMITKWPSVASSDSETWETRYSTHSSVNNVPMA